MTRLLLVDDDAELCEMLSEYLTGEGFAVDTAHNGRTALQRIAETQYELIVLDIMMPEINGLDVLRQLRKTALTPVIMLTARDEDVDSIIGLELGADDYLAKPCNPRVLVARLRAILRRSEPRDEGSPEAETLQVGDLIMHTGSRRVQHAHNPMSLTSTEYSVLEVLLRQAGHVVSKEDLSLQALSRQLARYDRSLDMHISSLRRKLGDRDKRLIQTVRGQGYLYALTSTRQRSDDP